jgi:oligopeptide/dipeptide ABC transporter ATP-binding protein
MEPIIRVDNIKKYFTISRGLIKKKVINIRAVDGVSFDIKKGETFGLVGESGSGKTTIARLVMRLTEPTENTVYLEGKDIFQARGRELREIRRRMGMVFQDPAASLNPRSTLWDSIKRPLEIHGYKEAEIKAMVDETIKRVALGKELLSRYPHQLSGGQQQRASIARAIILKPEFIVLDEPTSALDVSVQAQILNLLLEIQEEYNLTYLFITHNLSVVRYISDRIGVMYLGKMMEIASVEEIYNNPLHPYTVGLLSSAPALSPRYRNRRKLILSGDPPSLINPPAGCRLHPRCPYNAEVCRKEIPELREISFGHWLACHRAGELDFTGILR